MIELGEEMILKGLLLFMGSAFVMISVATWQLRKRQLRAGAELVQIKRVLEDFISIQERNMVSLRSGMDKVASRSKGRVGPRQKAVNGTLERRKQIWNLARQGLSPAQITHHVGMPRGQVDLLLNMSPYSGGINA